jgi:hypothetical protein
VGGVSSADTIELCAAARVFPVAVPTDRVTETATGSVLAIHQLYRLIRYR